MSQQEGCFFGTFYGSYAFLVGQFMQSFGIPLNLSKVSEKETQF